MASDDRSFGQIIAEERKKRGWSLKEVASRIMREEGGSISIQYLNDIEHDRRGPSSDHMVRQFAEIFELGKEGQEWLIYRAGRWPSELRSKLSKAEFSDGMTAFRRKVYG